MDKMNIRYKIMNGIIKNGAVLGVNTVHSNIPKSMLVDNENKINDMPELANILNAFDKAIPYYDKHHCNGGYMNSDSYKTLNKIKEVFATMMNTDSAYYIMFEYFLREYCVIKFGEQCLEQWDKQNEEKYQEMNKNKKHY